MDHFTKGTSSTFLVLQIFLLYLIGHSSLSLHQSPARCWGRMSWFPLLSLFLWALQVQILSWCGGHSSKTGISQWSLVTSAHPKALSRFTLSKSLIVDCQQRESWLEQSMPLKNKKKRSLKTCFQQYLGTGGLILVRCGLVHSAWCQTTTLFSLTLYLWV